jgi:hypothetical protein
MLGKLHERGELPTGAPWSAAVCTTKRTSAIARHIIYQAHYLTYERNVFKFFVSVPTVKCRRYFANLSVLAATAFQRVQEFLDEFSS